MASTHSLHAYVIAIVENCPSHDYTCGSMQLRSRVRQVKREPLRRFERLQVGLEQQTALVVDVLLALQIEIKPPHMPAHAIRNKLHHDLLSRREPAEGFLSRRCFSNMVDVRLNWSRSQQWNSRTSVHQSVLAKDLVTIPLRAKRIGMNETYRGALACMFRPGLVAAL